MSRDDTKNLHYQIQETDEVEEDAQTIGYDYSF
jgi:hypothetical protein